MSEFITAIRIYAVLTVLTGLVYPLLITGISQLIFPFQANGSLIVQNNKVIGSELLGQQFSNSKYFYSRPSATSPPYNAAASGGSNLGPTNPKLKKDESASGSGLDPHISPAAAQCQVERVASARGLSRDIIESLVKKHTKSPQLGILGEPVVNVLKLNIDLDLMQTNQK